MKYTPFKIKKSESGPATVATLATLSPFVPQTVATVATVARGIPENEAQSVATVATVAGVQPKNSHAGAAHRCDCGADGVIGIGWFIRRPEAARWFCAACAPTMGRS